MVYFLYFVLLVYHIVSIYTYVYKYIMEIETITSKSFLIADTICRWMVIKISRI